MFVFLFCLVECTCHQPGTVNGSNICEPGEGGHCPCKKNVEGPRCKTCRETYYDLHEDNVYGCTGNSFLCKQLNFIYQAETVITLSDLQALCLVVCRIYHCRYVIVAQGQYTSYMDNVAKCNLGKVKFKTMPVSGRPMLRLRGDLLSSLLGAPRGLHCICLLAGLCERSFCSLIFKPFFPLHPPFGKYLVW